MKTTQTKRFQYFLLFISTILLGLGSRKFDYLLPNFIAAYAGDTLWALMIYWGTRMVFTHIRIQTALYFALIFCFTIEISQLYQAEWILQVRATKLGALILGHGFLWSDLICYIVGCVFGYYVDKNSLSKTVSR
ncbi:ribosomal maturation YjgA family protein [Aureibacter tunicatorum]|uniref:DUF2809 domain-containing protein n=1 Tax=Aureibacter tunicatorum TaxID=866807 RepID=A0AAE3XP28_9BACT|nr:DUF2809 domain-containing protein [Aureibacter tunicatorum]MDR6240108.1 hypothetical protein [Aureibacter tunicatorum]BDD06011.1 hypothetical protein AUTU_34940 [Aureibacter tunicatorum]